MNGLLVAALIAVSALGIVRSLQDELTVVPQTVAILPQPQAVGPIPSAAPCQYVGGAIDVACTKREQMRYSIKEVK